MSIKNQIIHIVGGGVSGLIAARVLEDNGFDPVIIEATERIGGRLKTDLVDGYQLDRGFQVLLTAYPAVRKYLDTDELNLQTFVPGAAIFNKGKHTTIGDPLRDISLLFSTLGSGIGNLSDKIKVLKLNNLLKRKTLPEIFEATERTTQFYLTDFGFSSQMINQFFTPFFAGIFLEPDLTTSSRMFEFIYKMFGEGYAALPKSGIEAIPKQLAKGLTRTEFRFNTKVSSIKNGQLLLSTGENIKNDFSIVATDATDLIPNLNGLATQWKSCDTLYFETQTRVIKKPLIGLFPDSEALINNIFFHTSLEMTSKSQGELLSVTIVKNHDLSEEALILHVKSELKMHSGIDSTRFLKRYTISMALPDLKNIQNEIHPSETKLSSNIFLAGDTQLNGSLNAAMLAGESAALGVIEAIKGSL
ncbi:FAD-dependent oxidoreductase [bacterium]|nr:FAD-dependent oxidoreductase [bacterium]